ncbi:hypothetical protein [Chitinophaga nivalis]|uniref:SGNH/GDSL hydrolase family protein n=1 Tax=Chitinophaga nivalis TaxID=2991709 RepID=A0ABT3IH58_9BACT|nr:hypothetical protein [Chitinophaga nivalis]MCW3467036.1 hypothetical protein [Chitinophaga nivalis]MCW3483273.1 hypothetical protein [Chitinophaga nivalis]
MKYFLKKTVGISLLFFLSIIILLASTNTILKKKELFKIDPQDSLVVFGHSHAECSFNDSVISHFKNLGASGESYFYTFSKVKNVLKGNPQIKVVFVEFTNNQVMKEMDDWIWGNEKMLYRYSAYAPFLSFSDNALLLQHNLSGYIQCLSNTLKTHTSSIVKNNNSFSGMLGGYLPLHKHKADSFLAVQQATSHGKVTADTAISYENIRYLKQIVDFCHENNKQVYFVRSPQHKAYFLTKNENIFQQVRNEYFAAIPFLDFNAFPLVNAEYADLEHLNYEGAYKFSMYFNNLLKEGLLAQKDLPRFLNEKAATYH